MSRVASTALEALGALIAAGLIVGAALLLFGCEARIRIETKPVAAPPVDSPADEPVCHGDDCLLPKPKR